MGVLLGVSSVLAVGHHVWVVVGDVARRSEIGRDAKCWGDASRHVCIPLMTRSIACCSEVVSLPHVRITSILVLLPVEVPVSVSTFGS